MSLRIIVLVKQVPDTHNVTGEAMKEDGTVNRAALPAVFNPEDLNALEEALRLKERHGGRVSVLTMGPPAAVQVLRESLFHGADEVVLLSDAAFAGFKDDLLIRIRDIRVDGDKRVPRSAHP